jgi:hypothetical protein
LRDQKRSKVIGHEAIHLVLLVDTLMDDYSCTWEGNFAAAFDSFRHEFALGKKTQDDPNPSEYWLLYGVLTVNRRGVPTPIGKLSYCHP